MSRQLRVEHQLGGDAPGPLLPGRDELEDLVGLLRLGDTGIGVAGHAPGGVAGEEDQDALSATTPTGDIRLLRGLFLAVGRDGVEVEIERTAARQPRTMRLVGPRLEQAQVGAAIDARAVRRQVRALGDDIEAGEEGDPLVTGQVHDMTLAPLAAELEGQEGADRLLGGDRGRAGEVGRTENLGEVNVAHQRDEEPEAAEPGPEGARDEAQGADVGDGRRFGPERLRPFLIEAAWQACEALLAEEDGGGVDTDGVPCAGRFASDVVDGEVSLAHGDGEVPDAIALGGGVRSGGERGEEHGPSVGVVSELMTKGAKGPRCVAEAVRDLVGGELLDEGGAKGLVLPLMRRFGCQEEPGLWVVR